MLKLIKQFSLWLSLLLCGVPQVAPIIVSVAALSQDAEAVTIHGLNWDKANCDGGSDVRLLWSGAAYLSRTLHTAIWRYNPRAQSGYYAVLWNSPTGAWDGGAYSWGTHPFPTNDCQAEIDGNSTNPNSGSSTHCWENAGVGVAKDYLATSGTSPGYAVTKSQWHVQVRRVRIATSGSVCTIGDYEHTFIPDYSRAPSTKIVTCLPTASLGSDGGSPHFYFGASEWREDACGGGTSDETLSGYLRGIQLYDVALSDADIATEAANQYSNAAQTSAGQANLWYINQDPIPTDVADKKTGGTAHNPSWVNANRPVQWDSTYTTSFPGKAQLLGVGRP